MPISGHPASGSIFPLIVDSQRRREKTFDPSGNLETETALAPMMMIVPRESQNRV